MELKFRIWDEDSKTMIDWLSLTSTIMNRNGLSLAYSTLINNKNKMLFTGHLVNGINLYESDILRNTKEGDIEDINEYMVCVFIKEWAMFGLLTIDEYHKYNLEGAESLDESSFWTFPIYDKDNEHRRICGNIYSNPELLQSL